MAVKTYCLGSGLDGNFGALFEADQTAASRTDGWTVAKIGVGLSAEFDAGTKQASGTFTSTTSFPKPASSALTGTTADALKTPSPLTGVFANTVWTYTFAVRATVASSQTGRMRLVMYRSVNADGSAATAITGTAIGGTSSALSTTADVTTVCTANGTGLLGAVTLTNEYLFFAIAWEIQTASGNNSGDVVIRTGQATAGSRIVTPDFTASGGGSTYTKAGYAKENG